MRKNSAFTLAEVLIALAVLGVVAAFSIPKVLEAQQNEQRNAILKETYASLNQILYNSFLEGGLNAGTSSQYFISKLNALRVCSGSSNGEGCWNTAVQGDCGNEAAEPGVILVNGVQIIGLNNWVWRETTPVNAGDHGLYNAACIDWNGQAGPNQVGRDQMILGICASPLRQTCQYAGNQLKGQELKAHYNENFTAAQNQSNVDLVAEVLSK